MSQLPTSQLSPGRVYLVGAGPGDPGLITLRGVECLRRADVVLYDYLVNPRILQHARAGAELICLGKHGRTRIWSQDEINAKMVEAAMAGKTVVRLKSGDPAIFARGAEEAEHLVRNGVPFEIVPGITVALAAGSCAGIPVTHRELASAVALVTGREDDDKSGPALDYAALANFPGTLVFYMGVTSADKWSGALLAAGKPAETPVAIIRRCSFPDQLVIRCTLGELRDRLSAPASASAASSLKIRPPVIVVVGEVVKLAPVLSWFDKRPLFGVRMMVTRPREQAAALAEPLAELGAEIIEQPAIEITAPPDWGPVDDALSRLATFDWLVFSSANGVQFLLDRLLAGGRDARALGTIKIAAIGPGTADALTRYSLRADLQPDEFRAESLAAALSGDTHGKRFLLARASRGREVLAAELQAAGGTVEQVVVYSSVDVTTPDEETLRLLRAGRIDWITVTSSAIARSLAAMFGADLHQSRLASISPITSSTLRELGYEPATEASTFTMAGVVQAILQRTSSRSQFAAET